MPVADVSPPVTVAPVIPLDDFLIVCGYQPRVPARTWGKLMPERRLHHGKVNISPIGSQSNLAPEAFSLVGVGRRNSAPRRWPLGEESQPCY